MIRQEGIVWCARSLCALLIAITSEDADQIGADRHQSTLVELCLADRQDRIGEVHVGRLQGQRLTDPEPRRRSRGGSLHKRSPYISARTRERGRRILTPAEVPPGLEFDHRWRFPAHRRVPGRSPPPRCRARRIAARRSVVAAGSPGRVGRLWQRFAVSLRNVLSRDSAS